MRISAFFVTLQFDLLAVAYQIQVIDSSGERKKGNCYVEIN